MPQSAAQTPLIGTTLAHFHIEAEIGAGGMGTVYRATDEKLRRTVALKVLPAAFAEDPERRSRFLREARAAAAVTHANIATVHEVGEVDGRIYIAMELVEGRSLRTALAGGPLAIDEATRIAREVARALAKAHERGIVHRDIKPDNVMLTDDGDVKVLDFGLAKLRDASDDSASVVERQETESVVTREGRVLGTPAYMSPEQARGKEVDHRTDLFSLGVVFYEMLTGVRPFVGDSAMDVIIALTRDEPEAPSKKNAAVTPELEAIVARCMAKSPAARYPSAREVADALAELRSGARTSRSASRDSTIVAPAAPPASGARSRTRIWIALALVALAVVGVRTFAGPGETGTHGWTSSESSASASPPASAVAPAGWIDPPPASSNAEAVALYNDALRRYHDRSGGGNKRMKQASELDPEFAAAFYMHIIIRGAFDALANHVPYARAYALRDKLPPRDRAVLEAYEPLFQRTPADIATAARLLDAVAARFPDDPFVILQQVDLHGSLNREDSLALLERAASLAPREPMVQYTIAENFMRMGDLAGALAAIARCLELSPVAAMCLERRIQVLNQKGDCAGIEADARRWMILRPDLGEPYTHLTQALVALGRPIDAARDTAEQLDRLADEGRPRVEWPVKRGALESAGGDFVAAEQRLLELQRKIETSRIEADHAMVADELAETYSEIGDDPRAARVAHAFLRKHDAWDPAPFSGALAPTLDYSGALLRFAARGAMSQAEAEHMRAARIEWWRRRAPTSEPGAIWAAFYADGVMTPEEGAAAHAAFERLVPDGGKLPEQLAGDPWIGITEFLAGRVDEALPMLERQAATCRPLDGIVPFTRARFYLGRAREAKGDAAGACAEYARVLERWGSARPRSVTADATRARMRALACK